MTGHPGSFFSGPLDTKFCEGLDIPANKLGSLCNKIVILYQIYDKIFLFSCKKILKEKPCEFSVFVFYVAKILVKLMYWY